LLLPVVAPPFKIGLRGYCITGKLQESDSVVLAFASGSIARFAIPRSEVGSCYPAQHVRHEFPFARCVLPSGPSCAWLCHAPSTMPDKTPQGQVAVFRLPGACFSGRALGSSLGLFPVFPIFTSIAVCHNLAVHISGAAWGFLSSTASFPACHGLWTPTDLHTLAFQGVLVLPSVCVETLGIRNKRGCSGLLGKTLKRGDLFRVANPSTRDPKRSRFFVLVSRQLLTDSNF